jgi:hypothetical protein
MEIANADCSDLEKFEALGYGKREEPENVFKGVFDDTSIDTRTGELLGRYIAEEHDSGRMLRGCYQALKERAGKSGGSASGTRELHDRLDEICAAIGKLQQEVIALRR